MLWDEKLPRDFVLKCAEVVKTGTGYPAWMNNQVGIKFLCKQYAPEGMTEEEARAMAIGGCLETSPCCWKELTLNGKTYEIPVGAGNSTSIGVHFISNPKILSLVLDNGYDHKYKVQLFPPHDKKLETYEELWETYCEYYKYCIRVQQRCCNIQHDIHRKIDVPVWQSTLKPDAWKRATEHANMGFRYNATYNIETSGTISMVNCSGRSEKTGLRRQEVHPGSDAGRHPQQLRLLHRVGNQKLFHGRADQKGKHGAVRRHPFRLSAGAQVRQR